MERDFYADHFWETKVAEQGMRVHKPPLRKVGLATVSLYLWNNMLIVEQ